MVVDFSNINLKERPMLALKTQNGDTLQILGYAFNVEADLMYNEVSTLTFDLPAYVNGEKTPGYDEVKGTRLIDFVGVGMFLLVDPSTENDGVSEIKHCKAYSLEYEFTKKQFYIAGNEDDPDEDGNVGYKMVYKFYESVGGVNDRDSIIGRIHEKMPEWSFDVDEALWNVYRTFDGDVSDNVYNFIKSTVQETYSCIFQFDTYNRAVKVISTESVVPTRQVYLSQNNLIKKLELNEDSDSIVTCLDVNGEEGVSIRFVNPTGQNKIYDLHYFLDELPADLRTKWNEWTSACDSKRQDYFNRAMAYQVRIADTLTEEAKLAELDGTLKVEESVQGTLVQQAAENPDDPAIQSRLGPQKTKVDAAAQAVVTQKNVVAAKEAARNTIAEQLKAINYSLAWEAVRDKSGTVIGGPWTDSHGNPFTAEELTILNRYFFEDALEDASFALATTDSYTNKDVESSLENLTVTVTDATVEAPQSGASIYSIAGGELRLSSYLTARIVRGSVEITGGNVLLTAYLERGDYSRKRFEDDESETARTVFDCGTVTLTGTLSGNASITQSTEALPYSGSISFTVGNGSVYFTKNTTEYEQYSVEWDLYNYGRQVLEERSEPSYTFKVDAGNFLALDDYLAFQSELRLGERINLNLDGILRTPFVTSIHVNYEDLTDFEAEFSSTYRSSDSSFRLSQLLEQSVRMGKSLNIKGGMYSTFRTSGASTAVKDFMNSALDIAKNNVLSSENQAITFDETGLRLRQWKDREQGTYEDEQIWMNDNTIAFTDDGWNTAKMAIGKIFDPNIGFFRTKDTVRNTNKTYYERKPDGSYRKWTGATAWSRDLYEQNGSAYGIAAPYLVGTILAGSNLVITTKEGLFRMDDSGIAIKTSNLLLTNGNDETSDFDTTLSDAKEAAKNAAVSLAKNYTDKEFDEFMELYDRGDDDTIVTFYGANEPLEAEVGDLWYYDNQITVQRIGGNETKRVGTLKRCTNAYIQNGNTKYTSFKTVSAERFNYDKDRGQIDSNTIYYVLTYTATGTVTAREIYQGTVKKTNWTKHVAWEPVQDEDAIRAVASAADAQFVADGKINTFYSTTMPTADSTGLIPVGTGDLWYKVPPEPRANYIGKTDQTDGCQYGKMYWYDGTASAWKMVQDISIDRIDNTLIDYGTQILGLMDRMDDKMNTFYMNAEPSISDGLENSDLFFYTGSSDLSTTRNVITGGQTTHVFKPSHLYQVAISEHNGTLQVDSWTEIADQRIVDAAAAAQAAQNTADRKSTTYVRPTVPGTQTGDEEMDELDTGDLWFNTHNDGGGFWYPNQSADGAKYFRDGKLYRYEHRAGYPSWQNWVLTEDPDIDAKARQAAKKMRELMCILDANDSDMNVFKLNDTDDFNVVTAGAEEGDLLYYVGTSDRTVTVNGKSRTLTPRSLYRISVSGTTIAALTEETDADAKEAIEAAIRFQNFTDGKSTIYVQDAIPTTDNQGNPLDAHDNGDLWVVANDISGTNYKKDQTYRYEHPNWVRVRDPDIGDLFDYYDAVNSLAVKKSTTYYSNTIPTDATNGDLLYYTGTGTTVGQTTFVTNHLYRLRVSGSTATWEEINDGKAIAQAQAALNTADGKAKVYWQPDPPSMPQHSEGDIWHCTATGTDPVSSDQVDGGAYYPGRTYCCVNLGTDGTDNRKWVLMEDLGLKAEITDKYSQTIRDMMRAFNELDDQSNTFAMDDMPTVAANGLENNDLFLYIGNAPLTKTVSGTSYTFEPTHVYRATVTGTGSSRTLTGWTEITDREAINTIIGYASNAKDTVDQKITTHVLGSVPQGMTPKDVGDIWFCTADCSSGGVSYNAGNTYTYVRSGNEYIWQNVADIKSVYETFYGEVSRLNTSISAKTTTYYSDTIPAGATAGDLLYYTGATQFVCYDSDSPADSATKTVIKSANTQITSYSNGRLFYSYFTGNTGGGANLYDSDQWLYGSYDMPDYAGSVTSVDTSSAFYIRIKADFFDNGVLNRRTVRAGDDLSGKTLYFGINAMVFVKGHLYQRAEDGSGAQWVELQNPDAIRAIENARYAQDTADQKTVVYRSETAPTIGTHSKGDVWYKTTNDSTKWGTQGADGYTFGKTYYCDGTSWLEMTDQALKKSIEEKETGIYNKIAAFYNNQNPDGTYKLVADVLAGTIDATKTSMEAAGGKVVYNDYGIILTDKDTQSQRDTAVWLNEAGFLFGHKAVSGESDSEFTTTTAEESSAMGLSNNKFHWTTAINHAGITADALVGKTIAGATITAGKSLQVGEIKSGGVVTGYALTVDSNGNITAKNGTFSGTLEATDIMIKDKGTLKSLFSTKPSTNPQDTATVPQIDGDYLNVKQLNIVNDLGQTIISANKNGVTFKAGAISWSSINTTGSSFVDESDLATVATSGDYNDLINKPAGVTLPTYIKSTYIDSAEIRSPTIKANNFSVYPTDNSASGQGSFNLYGDYSGGQLHVFKIDYYAGVSPTASIDMPVGGRLDIGNNLHTILSFGYQSSASGTNQTSYMHFYGTIDFSNAVNVTGLYLKFTE